MTLRRVPRSVTDAALLHLRSTHQEHVRVSALGSTAGGRVRTSSTFLGYFDPVVVSRQGCLLRLISIVEAYVDTLSGELFQAAPVPAGAMFQHLVRDAELKGTTTWAERKAAFDRLHGIDFVKVPGWSGVQAGVEARNTVAHGLGRLTLKQRSGKDVTGTLAHLKITVSNNRIEVEEGSLSLCLAACLSFVQGIDVLTPPAVRRPAP